jgi:hypothetical protein
VNRKQNECSGFSILLVTILRSCLVTCTVRPISNGAESDKVCVWLPESYHIFQHAMVQILRIFSSDDIPLHSRKMVEALRSSWISFVISYN